MQLDEYFINLDSIVGVKYSHTHWSSTVPEPGWIIMLTGFSFYDGAGLLRFPFSNEEAYKWIDWYIRSKDGNPEAMIAAGKRQWEAQEAERNR